MFNSVEITVRSGKGGDGVASFRREKYVPRGGPDGGDGGKGGDVFLAVSDGVSGLDRFKAQRRFEAGSGERGSGQKMHGRDGADLTVTVPVGTVVRAVADNGRTLVADLSSAGQRVKVAEGGVGGLGNSHFATSVRQAPEKATKGGPGEERRLLLEHKPVVDIAIIGPPNSGKSALLGRLTAARPKVADYPFTTTETVAGVWDSGRERLILAEIPAIVPGASRGKGLGYRQLGDAGRARLLILLLDGSSLTLETDLKELEEELRLFSLELAGKPQLVAVSKIDIPAVLERVPELKKRLAAPQRLVFAVSAMTGAGVKELMEKALSIVQSVSREQPPPSPIPVLRPRPVDRRRP